MKINMAKQGAFGIMRELMAGGKEGNAIIQNIGHKANRFVLGSSKNGILFQHRPASVANGFTGIGLSPFAVGLGVAGIAGAGIANGVSAKKQVDRSFRPQAEDMGPLQTMSVDAQGSVVNGSRNLGATGDLVFGLHRMDRG